MYRAISTSNFLHVKGASHQMQYRMQNASLFLRQFSTSKSAAAESPPSASSTSPTSSASPTPSKSHYDQVLEKLEHEDLPVSLVNDRATFKMVKDISLNIFPQKAKILHAAQDAIDKAQGVNHTGDSSTSSSTQTDFRRLVSYTLDNGENINQLNKISRRSVQPSTGLFTLSAPPSFRPMSKSTRRELDIPQDVYIYRDGDVEVLLIPAYYSTSSNTIQSILKALPDFPDAAIINLSSPSNIPIIYSEVNGTYVSEEPSIAAYPIYLNPEMMNVASDVYDPAISPTEAAQLISYDTFKCCPDRGISKMAQSVHAMSINPILPRRRWWVTVDNAMKRLETTGVLYRYMEIAKKYGGKSHEKSKIQLKAAILELTLSRQEVEPSAHTISKFLSSTGFFSPIFEGKDLDQNEKRMHETEVTLTPLEGKEGKMGTKVVFNFKKQQKNDDVMDEKNDKNDKKDQKDQKDQNEGDITKPTPFKVPEMITMQIPRTIIPPLKNYADITQEEHDELREVYDIMVREVEIAVSFEQALLFAAAVRNQVTQFSESSPLHSISDPVEQREKHLESESEPPRRRILATLHGYAVEHFRQVYDVLEVLDEDDWFSLYYGFAATAQKKHRSEKDKENGVENDDETRKTLIKSMKNINRLFTDIYGPATTAEKTCQSCVFGYDEFGYYKAECMTLAATEQLHQLNINFRDEIGEKFGKEITNLSDSQCSVPYVESLTITSLATAKPRYRDPAFYMLNIMKPTLEKKAIVLGGGSIRDILRLDPNDRMNKSSIFHESFFAYSAYDRFIYAILETSPLHFHRLASIMYKWKSFWKKFW